MFDFEEGSDVMRTGEELFFGYACALDAATVSSRVAFAAAVSVVSPPRVHKLDTPYDTWISGDYDNSFCKDPLDAW